MNTRCVYCFGGWRGIRRSFVNGLVSGGGEVGKGMALWFRVMKAKRLLRWWRPMEVIVTKIMSTSAKKLGEEVHNEVVEA